MMLKNVKMPMAAGGGTSNRHSIRSALKRGFTIMELVIVIAVIAVLAAVLIPTFANIIQRANESNDISVARNMNTILATEQIGGEAPQSMDEATYILLQNGYSLDNLNPTAEGNYFAWDKGSNRLVYFDSEGTVLYSENGTYSTIASLNSNVYVTVGNADEIKTLSSKADGGIAFYLEEDIDLGTYSFDVPVSIDTGTHVLTADITYNFTTNDLINIEGTIIGNVTYNTAMATVNNYATVKAEGQNGGVVTLNSIGSNSYHEYGNVDKLVVSSSINSDAHIVIENSGYIGELDIAKTGVDITGAGYVKTVSGNTDSSYNNLVASDEYKYNIDDYFSLAVFRDKVNAGNDFEGINIVLNSDINLTGRAWEPIGNANAPFAGNFDGQNHTITGMSNIGYTPDSGLFGTTTNAQNYGIAYGFFGVIGSLEGEHSDTTITLENLKFVNVNIDTDYANMLGVLVGADVAATDKSTGDKVNSVYAANLNVKNVTASGSIKCTIGSTVGGIVGKVYLKGNSNEGAIKITDCINNCDITLSNSDLTDIKAGGILGFMSTAKFDIESCINNGDITINYQSNNNPDNYKGYYIGGIVSYKGSYTDGSGFTIKNCSMTGDIIATVTGETYNDETEKSMVQCAALIYGGGLNRTLVSEFGSWGNTATGTVTITVNDEAPIESHELYRGQTS